MIELLAVISCCVSVVDVKIIHEGLDITILFYTVTVWYGNQKSKYRRKLASVAHYKASLGQRVRPHPSRCYRMPLVTI